jgi:hypothetical protein
MPDEDKPEDVFPGENPYQHVHMWDILGVQYPTPPVHHPRIGATVVTLVLVKCATCNLPMTIELEGKWTHQQLVRNDAQIEHRGKDE